MADDTGGALGGPPIDGRDRAAIRADVRSRVPFYTGTAWDPDADGPGSVLLELFSGLSADVIERLDQVPAKHRYAFFDALGFDRQPPQPATLPLTVQVSDGAGGNVTVPGGTRALGESAAGSELTFEVESGFEATPAGLDRIVSVDPAVDYVGVHDLSPDTGAESTLFGGENDQRHRLYLANADALAVDMESESAAEPVLEVSFRTNAPTNLLDRLSWEYYGPPENADEPVEWRPLTRRDGGTTTPEEPVDITSIEEALDEYGYELTTESPDVVEQWLLSGVLARGLDRDAGEPPPYADTASNPELGELYAALVPVAREQLDVAGPEPGRESREETVTFDLPTVPEAEQFGVESRWIRCEIPEPLPQPPTERLFGVRLSEVTVATGREASGGKSSSIPADDLLANDVPLEKPESGDPVRPFGHRPQERDSFYVASEEAFTKTDKRVTLTVSLAEETKEGDLTPTLSWEYWNGSGWDLLPIAEGASSDSAMTFVGSGDDRIEVVFEVPEDLESTTVSGHEGHWIRARLVGGDYNTIEFVEDGSSNKWKRTDNTSEPVFDSLEISYGSSGGGLARFDPSQLRRENNLASEAVTGEFRPFEPVAAADQTLYLGFDGSLEGGPLQLFASLEDVSYPPEFYPRVRWEARLDGWEPLSVRDGTEGVTETGVVRFSLPEPTSPRSTFGAERHWLRARVTAPGGFVPLPYRRARGGETGGASGDGAGGESRNGAGGCGCGPGCTCGCTSGSRREDDDRCGSRLPTTPPGGGPAVALPTAHLLVPNTTFAANVRSISGEVVGSADGTPDQAFTVASPPVRSATVEVDELATLSAGARADLAADPDVGVEAVGPEADPEAFWVEWEQVDNFLASGPDDRHYTLDRVAGEVAFGDGTNGRVPPTSRDNVRVSYETGGGGAGNVDAGAVAEFEGSLAFVEGVTNHVPGDGGADAESSAAVLERAPRELRDRNRAVAPADFERLAKASARKLARAKCLPALDPRGDYRPGWVTVLVVPRSGATQPVPSSSLKEQVTAGLAASAPAALLGEEGDERLVVRKPTYVEATVEATVAAGATDSQSELEAAAAAALSEFFHPLSGGDDGTGWAFGELPCLSDCFAILEGVDGVDHVEDLRMRFSPDGADLTRTVRPGEEVPDVAPDVLLYSGTHEIDAVGGV